MNAICDSIWKFWRRKLHFCLNWLENCVTDQVTAIIWIFFSKALFTNTLQQIQHTLSFFLSHCAAPSWIHQFKCRIYWNELVMITAIDVREYILRNEKYCDKSQIHTKSVQCTNQWRLFFVFLSQHVSMTCTKILILNSSQRANPHTHTRTHIPKCTHIILQLCSFHLNKCLSSEKWQQQKWRRIVNSTTKKN